MTEIELSRKLGALHLRLSNEAMQRLIQEIKSSESIETLRQPYRDWLLYPSRIQTQYLTESARKSKN